jgi:hypothetical protein
MPQTAEQWRGIWLRKMDLLSNKEISKIRSPLANLNLKKGTT